MSDFASDTGSIVAEATPVPGTIDKTAIGKVSAGSAGTAFGQVSAGEAGGRGLRPSVRKNDMAADGGDGEDVEDEDLVDVDDCEEDCKSAASTGSFPSLPVALSEEKKIPCCCMCHKGAGEQSPLRGAHNGDKYGGFRPWAGYTKVGNHRRPKGKICLICTNVYSAFGYDVKYGRKGGFKDYKATIAKQSSVHHTFLAAANAWIKSFNGDGDKEMRLKTKKRLSQVKESLELLDEESQGFSAPKKVFVEEDQWE